MAGVGQVLWPPAGDGVTAPVALSHPMTSLAAPLLAHVGSAFFHACMHCGVHEAVHVVRERFFRSLSNHDVQRALRESWIVAVQMLRKSFAQEHASANNSVARGAFDRLVAQADRLFPRDETGDVDASGTPIDLLKTRALPPEALQTMLHGTYLPDELREYLVERLPGAFAFSFLELGWKGNEKARAALEVEFFTDVSVQQEAMQSVLADFRARFEAVVLEQADALLPLSEVRSRLEEVRDGLAQLRSLQTPRCRVYVSDDDSRQLTSTLVCKDVFTVGRSEESDVILTDAGVSQVHAQVKLRDDGLELRDLGSKAGTYVNGEKIRTHTCPIDTPFRIGPYTIRVDIADSGGGRRLASTQGFDR